MYKKFTNGLYAFAYNLLIYHYFLKGTLSSYQFQTLNAINVLIVYLWEDPEKGNL